VEGRLSLSPIKRLRSWTGVVFAALYALAFLALYVDYLMRAGTWFADLPLSLAALPFTLPMRALNGGSYAFGGDMSARVLAAGVFGAALAYLAGLILETIVRALGRFLLGAGALRP
jgi:hypothetical protein